MQGHFAILLAQHVDMMGLQGLLGTLERGGDLAAGQEATPAGAALPNDHTSVTLRGFAYQVLPPPHLLSIFASSLSLPVCVPASFEHCNPC